MATNKVYESGKVLPIATASTIASGDIVVVGGLAGVALADYNADTGKTTVDFGGVYEFTGNGVDDAGNSAIAVGDPVYYVSGDTYKVSKKASAGVFIGHAISTLDSGSHGTLQVRTSSNGGAIATNVFVSTEQTGTGSSQNVAHGFGATPSAVTVHLTEFTSGVNVDVAEGAHDATNVKVTVTNGVKFKVTAYR